MISLLVVYEQSSAGKTAALGLAGYGAYKLATHPTSQAALTAVRKSTKETPAVKATKETPAVKATNDKDHNYNIIQRAIRGGRTKSESSGGSLKPTAALHGSSVRSSGGKVDLKSKVHERENEPSYHISRLLGGSPKSAAKVTKFLQGD